MRLWHQDLIHYLQIQQLLDQHGECCVLRGKGWGKKHGIAVDYVFKYDIAHLYQYHTLVMGEMLHRNIAYDHSWLNRCYRGKNLPMDSIYDVGTYILEPGETVYSEHDDRYLKECLLNLKSKNAELVNGKTIDEWLIHLDMYNNDVKKES